MPHRFTVQPSGFQSIRRTIITRFAMAYGFLTLLITVLHALSPTETGTQQTWGYMVLMLAGVMTFTAFMTVKRQRAMYASFRLTVTSEGITREMINAPAITILRKDVCEIIKETNGGFTIVSKSKLNSITVPAPAQGAEELEYLLGDILPLTIKASADLKFKGTDVFVRRAAHPDTPKTPPRPELSRNAVASSYPEH